jgi:recombination protein RecT
MANNVVLYQEFGELTQQDITTVRETIAKDCNESQFKLFMSICKSSGANPVLNEIYPAVRQGQLTVQFGVDFYVRKAKEASGYLGCDVQLIHENDEFKMHQERAEDGRYYVVIDDHSWGMPRGKVIGGYAFAYREGMKPFTVVMEVEEVDHFKKSQIGMQKTMWTNYFNDMFKKHMLKRALKAAFELSFGEDEDRPKNSDEIPDYEHGRKEVSPEVTNTPEKETPKEEKGKKKPDPEPEKMDPYEEAKNEMNEKFAALGIQGKEKKGEYIAKNAKIKGEAPSLPELLGLLKIMDMDIENRKASEDELLG